MTPEEKAAYLENDDGIEAAHGVRVDAVRSAWTISFARGRVVEREERTHGAARGQRFGDVGRDLDGAAEPVRRLGLEGDGFSAHELRNTIQVYDSENAAAARGGRFSRRSGFFW